MSTWWRWVSEFDSTSSTPPCRMSWWTMMLASSCRIEGHVEVEVYGRCAMWPGTLWWNWWKFTFDTMNESRRRRKWAESFNSLVKMSALLMTPGICLTWMWPSAWASRTRFSRRLTCLILLVVTVDNQSTHAWLSLETTVGAVTSGRHISWQRWRTLTSSVTHSLVAITSASHELSAVWFWRIDFHAMGPPLRQMIKPDRDRSLNNSIGVPSGTVLLIWPPQQASLNAVSCILSDGDGGVASL